MECNKRTSCFSPNQYKQRIPLENFRDLILILVLWIFAIVLINPIGNFPLNDDWSWGWTVRNFIQNGKFQPLDWTPMTLISHVLWGTLFCLPFGFSFTALRISTLTIGIIGVIGLYLYLSKSNYPRQVRWAVSLTLLANPLYFSLSHTFMTDVPFTVFATVALIFLLENLHLGSKACLIWGTVFACLAVLSRQIGLIVGLAFLPAFLMRFGISVRNITRACIPLWAGIGVLAIFQYWIKSYGSLPIWYNYNLKTFIHSLRFPKNLIHQIFQNIFIIFIYLGMVLFPLLIFLLNKFVKRISKKRIAIYILIFLSFSVWASRITVFKGNTMPLHGNVLIPEGIGPLTLHDSYFSSTATYGNVPQTFWWCVTVIAICGAGFLLIFTLEAIFRFFSRGQIAFEQDQRPKLVFLTLCCFGYLLPISLSGFFDRYLLPVIISFSLFIVLGFVKDKFSANPFLSFAGFGAFIIFFLFSLLATHDYLAWNRIRWKALNYLTQVKKVNPASIDGGFEFNGFFLYDPEYISSAGKSWWWVKNNDYVISFRSLPMFKTEKKYIFKKWLPPGKGNIYILKKAVQ